MLVLTRKEGEKVVINPGEMGQITITLVRVSRDEVRIGVEAPKKNVVHRGEVWERIKESRKARGRES